MNDTGPGPSSRPLGSEFELTVYVSIFDPEFFVRCDGRERQAVLTVGDDWHGELLQVNFSSPSAMFQLARKLMETGAELERMLAAPSNRQRNKLDD